MRRILIPFVVVVLCIGLFTALWILYGRGISSFIDRYWTIEIESAPIYAVAYEGSGTGGILIFNDVPLSLNEVRPGISLSVGSTKDNQLALASGGKVFPLGPLTLTSENIGDRFGTVPPPDDQAVLATRHSVLSWPTLFDFNFMTGQSPLWKRHIYYEVRWKKSSDANLEMLWRYEQFFYPRNGWGNGFMTREGSTGLIRVEITK
jgi:hypothetical protein